MQNLRMRTVHSFCLDDHGGEKEKSFMERRECFGSIEEMTGSNGLTTVKTRPECRDCGDFRGCLHQNKQRAEEEKERDELRKQDLITQIIDISHLISNDIGSCMLEVLNRIYNSPIGMVLFKNLPLFYEIPRNANTFSFTIPISPSMVELMEGNAVRREQDQNPSGVSRQGKGKEEFYLRIIVIQGHFPNNQKANIGLIAREVARLFSSDPTGIHQILQTLHASEIGVFRKMDAEQQIEWLMKRWGFQEDLDALKNEMIKPQAPISK
jgi:hypothetical protein